MKKAITLLFILFSSLFATEIQEDASFTSIYADTKNNQKLVLMLYTAKSCPQCAYMKQKVFTDAKVQSFMQKHFVLLEKDINNDNLPEGFDYFGIPTMFFIDKNGKRVDTFIGSSRAEPFLKTLEKIVEDNL